MQQEENEGMIESVGLGAKVLRLWEDVRKRKEKKRIESME